MTKGFITRREPKSKRDVVIDTFIGFIFISLAVNTGSRIWIYIYASVIFVKNMIVYTPSKKTIAKDFLMVLLAFLFIFLWDKYV